MNSPTCQSYYTTQHKTNNNIHTMQTTIHSTLRESDRHIIINFFYPSFIQPIYLAFGRLHDSFHLGTCVGENERKTMKNAVIIMISAHTMHRCENNYEINKQNNNTCRIAHCESKCLLPLPNKSIVIRHTTSWPLQQQKTNKQTKNIYFSLYHICCIIQPNLSCRPCR